MKRIPLSQGKFALVDDEDYERLRVHSWHYHAGYAARNVRVMGVKGIRLMHHFIIERRPGMDVDHINQIGTDNRRDNLRICTRGQNLRNTRKRPGKSSTKKGVYLCKFTGRWAAPIMTNGKKTFLGRYDSELAAHEAYARAATQQHGEFACLG